MSNNELANEIRAGFNNMAAGIAEAGKKRINELLEKQGYVGFRNKDAAIAFMNKKEYSNFKMVYIDGEYKFYPVIKEEKIDLLQSYKDNTRDLNKTYTVSVQMLENNNCRYRLISTSKKDGKEEEIQSVEIPFYGKFSTEILPSIYNQMCDFPGIDYEKKGNNFYYAISSVDSNKKMIFGNLNEEQLQLIKQMKSFVENNKFDIQDSMKM